MRQTDACKVTCTDNKNASLIFLIIALLFFCNIAFFQRTHASSHGPQKQFLAADKAFVFDFRQQGPWLHLRWQIHPDYYLYRQQLKIEPQQVTLGNVVVPQGEEYDDEFYGNVAIFSGQLDLQIPLQQIKNSASVQVTYQGCAKAGFCYPPETRSVPLSMITDTDSEVTERTPGTSTAINSYQTSAMVALPFSPLWALLAGIIIAFTPCVLPLYPLISAIILGRDKPHSSRQTLLLALSYVQGMALAYTLLGIAVASAGLPLQATLQHPYILAGMSVVFVFLALSMFGLYSLQLPSALQTRLVTWSHRQQAGSLAGVFVMGALAGLICSPCTSAPLSAILLYSAQSGNVLAGGMTLYLYALGMGIPLLIVTVFGNRLLPRSGPWMQYVKEASGFLMLTLPLFLLERILDKSWIPVLWSLLGTAFLAWAFLLSLKGQQGWMRVLQILLLSAVFIVARPLQEAVWTTSTQQTPATSLAFKQVSSLTDIHHAFASAQGQYIMLDFYADWCSACQQLEKHTFSAADVQHQLRNTLVLQADVSANTPEQMALLKHFTVLGLPAILFFDATGHEIRQARVSGFMNAADFTNHLRRTLPAIP